MAKVSLKIYEQTKDAETHECQWCHERMSVDEEEFEYEVNFGWLCRGCILSLYSRGERLRLVH